MKKRFLIVAFLICISVNSCKKAPEAVKNHIKNYGENSQMKKVENKYVEVEELRNIDLDSYKKRYENLQLPNYIDIAEISSICEMKGIYKDDYIKRRKELWNSFGLENIVKVEKWDSLNVKGRNWYGNTYISGTNNGFFSYFNDIEKYSSLNADSEKYYLMRDENVKNETVVRDGMEISISDVVSDSKKEYRSDLVSREFEFKPLYIEFKDDNQTLSVEGSFSYKGIPFMSNYISAKMRGRELFKTGMSVDLDYKEGNKLVGYTSESMLTLTNKKHISKVLSLQSALDKVSKKLSGFNMVKIDEIKLVYCIIPERNEEHMEIEKGDKVTIIPAYNMMVRTNDKDADELNGYFNILVDMQTGEEIDDIGRNGLKPRKIK